MKNIREYENFHIALWLVKDICWVSDWKTAGMVMIVPTLSAAIHITWKARKNISELFHNIAVCLWIAANGVWMTGEFFYDDGFRPYATVFFIAGITVVGIYYIVHFPFRKKEEVLETNV